MHMQQFSLRVVHASFTGGCALELLAGYRRLNSLAGRDDCKFNIALWNKAEFGCSRLRNQA